MARNMFDLQVLQYLFLFDVTRSREALCKRRKETGQIGFAMEGAREAPNTPQTAEKAGGAGVLFQCFPQSRNLWGLPTFRFTIVSIFDGQHTLLKEFI